MQRLLWPHVWSVPAFLLVISLCACLGPGDPTPTRSESSAESGSDVMMALRDALTFHASFDTGVDADWALGDHQLYTAPSYDELDAASPGLRNPDVEVARDVGRFGHALQFTDRNQHAIYYDADDNVSYSPTEWSGTVSFWLSLDPATDLEPGFCDPIQITDTAYNDAAIWVDFTAENPRQFRLGVFGDLDIWNPDGLSPDSNPAFDDRLVVVETPPFAAAWWTHVAITHSGLNGGEGGVATLYLDGERVQTSTGIDESFSWEPGRGAIRLGVNYVGFFDDLSLFNRALTDEEVGRLHALATGVVELHP